MHRRTPLVAVLAGLATAAGTAPATAEIVTVSVPVTVTVCSRTSLKVSSDTLRFDAGAAGADASASVDFSAAGRTARDGELVLSVEPLGGGDRPGGGEPITFVGSGEGTRSGALRPDSPTVAARWIGSGLRTGTLTFSWRPAAPGSYAVPLRFVLSTP
jgi:hypothetical protein